MFSHTLTPFVLEAIEEALGTSPCLSYISSKKIGLVVGGLYLRVFVKKAPDGTFPGHDLVDHLANGKNLFLVNPTAREGLLFLYLRPLPFFHTPETLDWRALTLAASSRVHLPGYVFGEVAP